ncbi:CdaR family transcriptional regulator [Jeotgalibacillus marinus]|uniref:Sugar diacid recognition domain-containing protein n=1 Tax=Jeotgalibacillus marinus TaxID=86667 RepID=A0ABV3Q5P6_9BACL
MLFTPTIARKIVLETMAIIPYNINIFDHAGRIIASGDAKRLDQLHQGALVVLETKQTFEVTDESLLGAQKGINMPIIVNHTLLGVVGITGEVNEVRPFATMVKSHIELFLKQQVLLQELERQKRAQDYFFIDLFSEKMTIEQALSRTELLSLPLKQKLYLMVFSCASPKELDKITRFLSNAPSCIVIAQTQLNEGIMLVNHPVHSFTQLANEEQVYFSSSTELIDLHEYKEHYELCKTLLLIGKRTNRFFNTPSVLDVDSLLGHTDPFLKKLFLRNTLANLLDYSVLIVTLKAFFDFDLNISKTASALLIQRATVVAHLDKIKSLTDLDPKKAKDCFRLISALNLYEQIERS